MSAERTGEDQEELPFQRHSATSEAAAESMKPTAGTLRAKVLEAIRASGGMTDEEIQERLHINPSTQRPRRIELVAGGLVEDSGKAKLTRSGRFATIWIAK